MKIRITYTYSMDEDKDTKDKESKLYEIEEKMYDFLENHGYYQSSETEMFEKHKIINPDLIKYNRLTQTYHEAIKKENNNEM